MHGSRDGSCEMPPGCYSHDCQRHFTGSRVGQRTSQSDAPQGLWSCTRAMSSSFCALVQLPMRELSRCPAECPLRGLRTPPTIAMWRGPGSSNSARPGSLLSCWASCRHDCAGNHHQHCVDPFCRLTKCFLTSLHAQVSCFHKEEARQLCSVCISQQLHDIQAADLEGHWHGAGEAAIAQRWAARAAGLSAGAGFRCFPGLSHLTHPTEPAACSVHLHMRGQRSSCVLQLNSDGRDRLCMDAGAIAIEIWLRNGHGGGGTSTLHNCISAQGLPLNSQNLMPLHHWQQKGAAAAYPGAQWHQ